MATKIGSLLIRLGLDSGEFKSGLAVSERELRQSVRRFERMGRDMQRFGQRMTLAVTAPLVAFGTLSFRAASDAAELQSAFDQTFGAMSVEMNRWAEETGDALGRSTQSMQELANTFGIFFNQAAPTRNEAARMSQTFAVLAQDLASFYNVTEDVALGKLRSGLAGEAEPLRDFGVFLSSAAVNAKALELGLAATTAEITEQDKILARYNLILEATTNAQGDVLRTSDGTANQMRRAAAAFEELQVAIGTKLLPAFTPLIEKIGGLLDRFARLPDGVQTAIIALAGLAAVIGPIAFVMGSVIKLGAPFLAAITAAGGAGATLAGLKASLAGLAAGFAPVLLAVGAVYLAWRNWDEIEPRIRPIVEQVRALGEGLGLLQVDVEATHAELAKEEGWRTFGRNVAAAGQWVADLTDKSNAAGLAINAWARQAAADVVEMANAIGAAMQRMAEQIHQWLVGRLNAVWREVTARVEQVKRVFFELYDAVVGNSYIPDMVDGIANQMARLDQVMVDPARRATRDSAEAFRDMASAVRGILDRLFPEAAAVRTYRDELALLDRAHASGALSAIAHAEATARLRRELAQVPIDGSPPVLGRIVPATLPVEIGNLAHLVDTSLLKLGARASEFGDIAGRAFESFTYQLEGFLLGAQSALDAVRNLVRELASAAFRQFIVRPLGAALGLQIPGFATGTLAAPKGLALVGERGPEIVNFSGGEQVYTASDSRRMLGGAGSMGAGITINVNGPMSHQQARETGATIAQRLRQSLNGG